MKKFALIIVLTVSLGLAGAIMVDQASAFGFFGKGFGGGYGAGYGCGYGAAYYGLMPYWGYGYGCGYGYPGYWGKMEEIQTCQEHVSKASDRSAI